jgi:eukaryotic-like serine/threonine-protein kinase
MDMEKSQPWLERWELVKELSGGGQGTTLLVKSNDGGLVVQSAVIKVLKYQRDAEARRRMFREVGNLKSLHSAGCRVPRILDSNVESFELPEMNLYFVMEFVEGKTLSEFVRDRRGLPLGEAAEIANDLASTLQTAIAENIIHRDLKPENILVRSHPSDSVRRHECTIVDYGLSFNTKAVDEGLTRTTETIDNSFLSLPERRIPGGDRRDPRSDITGLCGILYFCLTGHPPVDLVGPDNRPPHRRAGHSVREKLGTLPQMQVLESFFDKGFSPNINLRFQTIEEFRLRLAEVLDPKIKVARESPREVAKRAGQALVESNRSSQITAFREKASNRLHGAIYPKYQEYNTHIDALSPFRIDQHKGRKEHVKAVKGAERKTSGQESRQNRLTFALCLSC